ncbi:MAG TPA: hypothetical protein DEP35_15595 [Deltaproteobacteria bacterium]|nr:hypothetical protein [Deltaproteobacteria bacterium]
MILERFGVRRNQPFQKFDPDLRVPMGDKTRRCHHIERPQKARGCPLAESGIARSAELSVSFDVLHQPRGEQAPLLNETPRDGSAGEGRFRPTFVTRLQDVLIRKLAVGGRIVSLIDQYL